ncbi:MAG: DEAD/DEAH box helicase family protein, partial [Bacteroidetes bacterium]|nr:DEAD/DEAH box helicase family protein [Bacteroidota bacterium]
MKATKEAQARIKINRLLEESGWRLTDSDKGKANVSLETKTPLGDDFEHVKNGFIDYLLLDNNQKPVCVLEAKRESIPPLSAKEQARRYANSIHARYVILSNGNTHYLWDLQFGNPEPVSTFPTLEMLVCNEDFKPDIQSLADENITNNYIARSQRPDFESDPSYLDESTRKEFIEKNKLKILRNYQVQAIKAIQTSARNGNTRFLLEMATGTGKTLTCAAIIKLFLQTGNTRRALFLVDRIELENQAEKAFTQAIGNAYTVKIYKKDKDGWNTADILISTVQTLQSSDRFRNFSPTDFDLLISDEAHRSIGGNARAVFEYFKGFKIGLTATPKDYLKNADTDSNTEKSYEKRLLLDTYRTFGCESGEPTFRYSLTDGVSDPDGPFLVNPETVKILTEISTQLLSDEGLDVHRITEESEEIDETFGIKDYEKKFFNHETNVTWCRAFIENAMRDPISEEMGKSIIF